ncbi:MAG: PH domain-containing protein [Jejuia sp.]
MKVYKSKIEYGFYLTIFLLFSLPLGSFIISNKPLIQILVYTCFLGSVFVFICYVILSIRYFIQDKLLKIRIGFLYNKDINIDEIKSIRKYHSIIAYPTPAASLDRIEINYGKYDSVIISPENGKVFLKDLLAINSEIELGEKIEK